MANIPQGIFIMSTLYREQRKSLDETPENLAKNTEFFILLIGQDITKEQKNKPINEKYLL